MRQLKQMAMKIIFMYINDLHSWIFFKIINNSTLRMEYVELMLKVFDTEI